MCWRNTHNRRHSLDDAQDWTSSEGGGTGRKGGQVGTGPTFVFVLGWEDRATGVLGFDCVTGGRPLAGLPGGDSFFFSSSAA